MVHLFAPQHDDISQTVLANRIIISNAEQDTRHLLLHLQVRICQVQQAAIRFDLPFTIGSCLIASEAALNFS